MTDKRTEIMDAAERRIRSAGYSGFSFREVAEDVGVKSASVHYHFPTKEDLGAAVARRYSDRFFAWLDGRAEEPSAALCAAFARAIRVDKLACLCGVLGAAAGSLPEPVSNEARLFFERAIDYLLDGRKSRKDREWAFRVVALLEGAMMLSLALGDAELFRAATRSLPARPLARKAT